MRPDFKAHLTRFVSSSFTCGIFIYFYETEIPEMTDHAEMIATVVLAKGRRTTRGYYNVVAPPMGDVKTEG